LLAGVEFGGSVEFWAVGELVGVAAGGEDDCATAKAAVFRIKNVGRIKRLFRRFTKDLKLTDSRKCESERTCSL